MKEETIMDAIERGKEELTQEQVARDMGQAVARHVGEYYKALQDYHLPYDLVSNLVTVLAQQYTAWYMDL